MATSNATYLYCDTLRRKISPIRQALPQIFAVSIKNILLVGFGMTLGFPTILVAGLSEAKETFRMSEEELSWMGSINLICVPVGCILSGPLSQKFGRKRMMQAANVPLAATWLLFKFSNTTWQIYLGLGIIGLLLGCIEAPVITYVAEITTPNLRGVLSSTSTMSTILGILIEFLLGSFLHWRNVALFSFIVPILSTNLLILVPESPIWLINQNRFLDARVSLAWLRGCVGVDEIDAEFREIHKEINLADSNSQKNGAFRYLACKNFLWPFGVVALAFFLRHVTGMTNVQTYAVEIFEIFKTPIDKYYATTILGGVELIGCFVCVALVHCVGKRKLTFVTMFASILCLLGVAMHTHLDETFVTNWVPTGCLLGFALFSHAGLRILPWILAGEVYNNQTRAIGSGLSAAFGYLCGFIVNKLFYTLLRLLGIAGLFYFYSAVSLIGLIALYYVLPETEGKTLTEIGEYFSGNKMIDLDEKKQSQEDLYSVTMQTLNNVNGRGNSYKRFSDLDTPV